MDQDKEIWKLIPGYSVYEVSNLGRVKRIAASQRSSIGFVLKPVPGSKAGYLRVTLSEKGYRKAWDVHVLVMSAFEGPTPEGMEIRHIDGSPDNPRRDNLEFGTHKRNGEDMIRHGRTLKGVHNKGTSKATEEEVLAMRKDHAEGMSGNAIAEKYGRGVMTISNIVRRKTWTHI